MRQFPGCFALLLAASGNTTGCHQVPTYDVVDPRTPIFRLEPVCEELTPSHILVQDEKFEVLWEIEWTGGPPVKELYLSYGTAPEGFRQRFPPAGKSPKQLKAVSRSALLVYDYSCWRNTYGVRLTGNGRGVYFDNTAGPTEHADPRKGARGKELFEEMRALHGFD